MKAIRKVTVLVFTLVFALALSACSGNPASSASSSASDASASISASSAEAGELVGKPWVTTVLMGNLPAEQPEAKDDLYTHYNYEYLAAHQGKSASVVDEHAGEPQAAITAIVKDESKTGHDLDQLRILYNQAADTKTLKEIGLSEVQPYLDRIDAVTSIDEMNALLVAEDFPFSPFVIALVAISDTRATNIVSINPNLVLFDIETADGMYYKDYDDPQTQQAAQSILTSAASASIVDLRAAGMSQDEAMTAMTQVINFEKTHGQYVASTSEYLKADYGALADALRNSFYSLDEMCALAPNVPLKGILDKMRKGGSEAYTLKKEWLEALNGLWTEENLDTIKLVAKTKVLDDTRPYRDASLMNDVLEEGGQTAPDADAFAYTACTSLDTLANVAAKAYVDDVLSPNAKERLTKLSQDLVDTYKPLVGNTPWMGEESRQRVIEKLDHMTLNVLEPQGGYFDYSGIDLVPTDQGGTLFTNYLKLKQYRYDCESKLIGQPAVAATTWFEVAPTASNAFYDPTSNSINIFPGFVTSLLYTEEMDDNELLACSGFAIGHEISHGFDYLGSQVDAYGQPNPVFTAADLDSFVLKTSTLALYYQNIEVLPGLMVDGRLVVGEAAADICGLQACLELASKVDGFDYDKYYAGLSNMWALVMTENELQRSIMNSHPLNNLRVNVSSQMVDALYDKLGVTEGDGMYLAPDERIVVWGPNA